MCDSRVDGRRLDLESTFAGLEISAGPAAQLHEARTGVPHRGVNSPHLGVNS